MGVDVKFFKKQIPLFVFIQKVKPVQTLPSDEHKSLHWFIVLALYVKAKSFPLKSIFVSIHEQTEVYWALFIAIKFIINIITIEFEDKLEIIAREYIGKDQHVYRRIFGSIIYIDYLDWLFILMIYIAPTPSKK